MNEVSMPTSSQAAQDAQHLDILRIVYLVVGWLNVAIAGFLLIVLGIVAVFGAQLFANGPKGQMPPAAFGLLMGFVGLFVVLAALAGGLLYLKVASCLRDRRGKSWIYVAAALSCPSVPVGTALGVFTFVVLSRPTVAALFDERSLIG